MKCPNCNVEDQSSVVDSRPCSWGIKRVRRCLHCGVKFPTIEVTEITEEAINSLNRSIKIHNTKEKKK